MAVETANFLVEAIRELDLFDPARMDRLSRGLAERFPRSRDLARELIRAEWLTAFQVNQLLTGRGSLLLLGPYLLLERLGAGGMGEVFKARHRKLDRVAALKVISRHKLTHEATVRRFLREAESAARLSHPNIVAVHDAGAAGDRYYLAMECIDGIDLGRLLLENGPLPVSLACDFIRQAALGLHHAHEAGFVHRDIKPANLIVAPRGGLGPPGPVDLDRLRGATLKVLDMGLVRSEVDGIEDSEMALTQKGVVLGTMDYLAPEQARNSHHVDRRADLYGLGCTLFHLLAGRPPFAGGQALDKLLRHQSEPPPPLKQFRLGIPDSLQAIVSRLLAKRPEDRFQRADELALALVALANQNVDTVEFEVRRPAPPAGGAALFPTRILDTPPSEAESPTDVTQELLPPSARSAGHRRLRHGWWLAAAVVLVGLFGGLTARLLVRPAPAREDRSRPSPRGGLVGQQKAIDHLADYVAADSAAVLSVSPGELSRATIVKERETVERALKVNPTLTGLFDHLSIDPTREVDWIRGHVPADRPEQTHWLVRGKFPSRQPDGHVFQPKGWDSLFVARRGPYLLASPDRDHVKQALDTAGKGPASVSDQTMRRLLARVDRNQTVWLAVTPPRLGRPPKWKRDQGLGGVLPLVLKHTSAIQGGVSFGRDLRLRLVLEGDESGLAVIERKLEGMKKMARGWLFRNSEAPRDQRLWFLVFAEVRCRLRGTTLEIESQVMPVQLN